MKRLTKRHLLISGSAVAVIFMLFYGAATTAGTSMKSIGTEIPTASVYAQNIHLFSNGSAGFILASTNGKTTKICLLNTDGSVCNDKISLDYAYASAEIHNQEIYFSSSTDITPTATVFGIKSSRYPLGEMIHNFDATYSLSNIRNSSLQGITEDINGYVYVLNDSAKNKLSIFTNVPNQAPSVILSSHGDFTSICISPDSYLYTTYDTGNQIGIQNVKFGKPIKEPFLFSSDIPAIPYRFLNSTTVLDKNGGLFLVQGSVHALHKIKDIPGSSSAACALSSGEILCKTSSRAVGKFASDGTFLSEYKFDGELLDLATNGTVTAAIVSEGSSLRFVDLSKPTTNGESSSSDSGLSSSSSGSSESVPVSSNVSSSDAPTSSGTSSTPSIPISSSSNITSTSSEHPNEPAGSDPSSGTSSQPQIPSSIQSNTYPIDRNAGLLKVGASTSFAQLKKGIQSGSASLRAVKPNGTILESGNIGTGTVIELRENDRVIDSLVVVVKGDFVGSGNITSRDKHLLYAHLNNSNSLSGTYLEAADINEDNIVDTSDLLLLKKLVPVS